MRMPISLVRVCCSLPGRRPSVILLFGEALCLRRQCRHLSICSIEDRIDIAEDAECLETYPGLLLRLPLNHRTWARDFRMMKRTLSDHLVAMYTKLFPWRFRYRFGSPLIGPLMKMKGNKVTIRDFDVFLNPDDKTATELFLVHAQAGDWIWESYEISLFLNLSRQTRTLWRWTWEPITARTPLRLALWLVKEWYKA